MFLVRQRHHPRYVPGSSQYNTISTGTFVTVHGLDSTSHLNDRKVCVTRFNSQTGKCRVAIGDSIVEVTPSVLFQNIYVYLGETSWLKVNVASMKYALIRSIKITRTKQAAFLLAHKLWCFGTIARLEGLD